MRQKDYHTPATIIFQRLQAEDALKELEREEARCRLARNVRTVWSQRTFLVRLSVLGLGLGLLAAFLIPARYTSTTRLMASDYQPGSSLAMAATTIGASHANEIATSLLGLKSPSDAFVGILTTRKAQDQIIEQLDLRHVYRVSRMGEARIILANSTSISVDRKSQIITIAITDRDPKRAAAIGEAYIAELNRLVAELSTSSARRERIFLEERIKAVSQDLESAEKDLSQFSSKNTAIDIKEQGKVMVEAAATLQGQYIAAQTELEGLKQIYTDSNVRVRTANARIAELKRQLEKLGGKGEDASETSGQPANYPYPSARKLPLIGVTYADLYRRTRVQEAVYEVLTQEYELAKVQEAKEIPIVKVVDPADIPESKSFPPRLLIGTSTMFLAFIGGIAFVVASKSWHEKDPDDPSKAIATEIWTDLKEKRLLNSVNGVSHEPGIDASRSPYRRRSVFSFLGLNKQTHNGNGFSSVSHHVSEEELSEKEM